MYFRVFTCVCFCVDPVESETSEALVYRESPSYDEVMRRHVRTNGHSLDILDQGLSHPRTHITHRFSWMNPSDIPTANGHVPNHYLATPFPPELTRIQHQSNHIGPLTNSTPELRTSGAVKPSQLNPPLSCSTPDLLSMTGPVPARRVLVRRPEQNDVFVSHSQELPMVRQTAVDDLTVSTFPNGNGLVADKSKHFDAVVEEDVPSNFCGKSNYRVLFCCLNRRQRKPHMFRCKDRYLFHSRRKGIE